MAEAPATDEPQVQDKPTPQGGESTQEPVENKNTSAPDLPQSPNQPSTTPEQATPTTPVAPEAPKQGGNPISNFINRILGK